jgi:hypothetical protein
MAHVFHSERERIFHLESHLIEINESARLMASYRPRYRSV